MEKIKKENKNSTKFSRWLDSIDEKAAKKGAKIKLLWQIAKFCIVSLLVSAIQLALVNLLFFCMKSWVDPLPGFLGDIFNEETMGPGHSNWGYILPFSCISHEGTGCPLEGVKAQSTFSRES